VLELDLAVVVNPGGHTCRPGSVEEMQFARGCEQFSLGARLPTPPGTGQGEPSDQSDLAVLDLEPRDVTIIDAATSVEIGGSITSEHGTMGMATDDHLPARNQPLDDASFDLLLVIDHTALNGLSLDDAHRSHAVLRVKGPHDTQQLQPPPDVADQQSAE
jgi:hypothetical protein